MPFYFGEWRKATLSEQRRHMGLLLFVGKLKKKLVVQAG